MALTGGRTFHVGLLPGFLLFVQPGVSLGAGTTEPETRILHAQDFEKSSPGELPESVSDNSGWAGATVPMEVVDSGDTRYGKVLQCNISGFAQIILGLIEPFESGKVYRVTLSISSKGHQMCRVYLRRDRSPYTTYMSSTVTANEQMQRASFVGKAMKTDRVFLMLRTDGVTTLYIDDIRIEEVAGELPPGDPPVPGNLLPNAGFELSNDCWYVRGKCEFLKSKGAYEGRRAVKLFADGRGLISSSWLRLSRRCEYIVRARVRSMSPSTSVRMGLGDYVFPRGTTTGHAKTYTIKQEQGWNTVSFKWRPPVPSTTITPNSELYFYMRCEGPPGGVALVDAIEVKAAWGEDDGLFSPHAAVELALFTDAPQNVATTGEPVKVRVLARGKSSDNVLEIRDEYGKLFRTVGILLQDQEASTALTDLPCGYWRLLTRPAQPDRQQTKRVEGETFVAVVPVMPELPVEQWMFGCHIPIEVNARSACWKLGLRWDRFHDTCRATKWSFVQREPGTWLPNDDEVASHRVEGHMILGSLGRVPGWVPKKPTADELRPWSDETFPLWQTYSRRCAEHWKGKIDYWEVMNEPSLSGMLPEHYLKILKSAYNGVKAGNSNAVVVGLGGGTPITSSWITDVIALGAGKYCDVVSIHGYGGTTWGALGGPERLAADIGRIRSALEAAGTPGLPIWDTECGTAAKSSFTKVYTALGRVEPIEAARMFAKSVAVAKAAALDKVFYYSAHTTTHAGDGDGLRFLMDFNGAIKMNGQSLAVAVSMLEGRKYAGQNRESRDKNIIEMVFTGRNATVHMFWKTHGSISLAVPSHVHHVVNMWGRQIKSGKGEITLNQDPLYMVFSE